MSSRMFVCVCVYLLHKQFAWAAEHAALRGLKQDKFSNCFPF